MVRMNRRRLARRLIVGLNVLAPFAALDLLVSGHGWWTLAVIACAHAVWLLPTLWPACDWCGEVVCTIPHGGAKHVWLTIDDGPDPGDTPRLLDLLNQHGARATFFFIGAKAAQHPELVREVVKRGHTLGNHTMTHPQFWFWAYVNGAARREIRECQRVLTEITGGTAPQWFRAPAGLKNPCVQGIVERENLRLACWTARGLDGVDADKSRVLARLKREVHPGAIVLMHEGRTDAQGARLAPQVLGELLTWLASNGYRCVLPDVA